MKKSNWPEPRIYVACLASYNAGKLHGEWLDATETIDVIRQQVQTMLATSPEPHAEEFAIHDYEGFGGLTIREYESLDRVVELAGFVEEHGFVGTEVLSHSGDLEEARVLLSDRYVGEFDDLASFAEYLLEEHGELDKVPESLQRYIDFGAYARDLEMGGEIFYVSIDRQIHVFWTN